MWLRKELQKIQINSLSIRQQLDLIQDNAYIRSNLNSIISTSNVLASVGIQNNLGDAHEIRIIREIDLAWNNIRDYFSFLFPIIWKIIGDSDVVTSSFSEIKLPPSIKDIKIRIQSCKKIIEVSKTLVYGGALRIPFSQDLSIRNLYTELLSLCQKSDISGAHSISGQNRVSFLQIWLEKLVLKYSISTYFIEQIGLNSPKLLIKAEPAQVSTTKFTVSKIPIPKSKICNPSQLSDDPPSSNSTDTTFSAYLNSDIHKTPKFVGLKIKFDSESSDSSCSSANSEDSVWDPVFKRRKINTPNQDSSRS